MQLTAEDRTLIRNSLGRLCEELETRLFARPEQVLDPGELGGVLDRFIAQGMLHLEADPGCGLWEDCEDPANLVATLDYLTLVAKTNGALAFALHRSALAACLLRDLGAPVCLAGLCLHGRHGLGRGDLAAWWQGRGEVTSLLSDVFDQRSPRLALMHGNTPHVLLPVFRDGSLHWHVCSPKASCPGMGLDELWHVEVRPAEGDALTVQDDRNARHLARRLWARDWLGLLAIEQGCLTWARGLAGNHVNLRYQGGMLIARHPAVRAMMVDIDAALAETAAFLASASDSEAFFGSLLQARDRLQRDLCTGVNNCMQILGGTGYMRDQGIEKCFRDINQTRLQSGGPLDMQLLAAAWGENS